MTGRAVHLPRRRAWFWEVPHEELRDSVRYYGPYDSPEQAAAEGSARELDSSLKRKS